MPNLSPPCHSLSVGNVTFTSYHGEWCMMVKNNELGAIQREMAMAYFNELSSIFLDGVWRVTKTQASVTSQVNKTELKCSGKSFITISLRIRSNDK